MSIKDGVDLDTAAGHLMANVLASVAAYENEVRAERVIAGQAAARAAGKTWGGSQPGVRKKITPEQETVIVQMKDEGAAVTTIAKTVGVSRPTVYDVLDRSIDAGDGGYERSIPLVVFTRHVLSSTFQTAAVCRTDAGSGRQIARQVTPFMGHLCDGDETL